MTNPTARADRERLAGDPHRPRWHFAAPANWLNDPNGLIQWRGRTHLFYQYHPHGPLWGAIHWGHATSVDLLHWTDEPVALAPTPGGPDADGCWSGGAVNDNGVATILYTGAAGGRETTCRATAVDDDLRQWRKDPANPVIAGPPPGLATVGFRDHTLWRQGDEWRMAIGSGLRGIGGAALSYRSPDLRDWRFTGPLCAGDGGATGEMWECPDFFALGDRHALVISALPARQPLALLGHYDGARFTPERVAPVDAGRSFYAPQSFIDGRGRRIMIGWLAEERPDAELVAAGWAGMLALPRELLALPDGALGLVPISEIARLRAAPWPMPEHELLPGAPLTLPPAPDGCCEVALTGTPGAGARLRLDLLAGADPLATITVDRGAGRLSVAGAADRAMPLDTPPERPLSLRVFVDRSVIEVFADDRACATRRVYPAQPTDLRLRLTAEGQAITLRDLTVWPLRATWG